MVRVLWRRPARAAFVLWDWTLPLLLVLPRAPLAVGPCGVFAERLLVLINGPGSGRWRWCLIDSLASGSAISRIPSALHSDITGPYSRHGLMPFRYRKLVLPLGKARSYRGQCPLPLLCQTPRLYQARPRAACDRPRKDHPGRCRQEPRRRRLDSLQQGWCLQFGRPWRQGREEVSFGTCRTKLTELGSILSTWTTRLPKRLTDSRLTDLPVPSLPPSPSNSDATLSLDALSPLLGR